MPIAARVVAIWDLKQIQIDEARVRLPLVFATRRPDRLDVDSNCWREIKICEQFYIRWLATRFNLEGR